MEIADALAARRCPAGDAIYFADGTVSRLLGSPAAGFENAPRVPLREDAHLLDRAWACLSESPGCIAQSDPYVVTGGGAPSGRDGFIALSDQRSGRCLWLLHCETSGPFHRVAIEGYSVRGESSGRNGSFTWSLPLENPSWVLVRPVTA
jgi:hypothetical protein